MKDVWKKEALRVGRNFGEPTASSIAGMRQDVVNALLDGFQPLLELDCATITLSDDEFIVLAALPTIMRREYLSRFHSTACLINSKLLLASRDDWQSWVTGMNKIWRQGQAG